MVSLDEERFSSWLANASDHELVRDATAIYRMLNVPYACDSVLVDLLLNLLDLYYAEAFRRFSAMVK